MGLKNWSDSLIYTDGVLGFILLMYLDIFSWLEAANLIVAHGSYRDGFPGPLVLDSPLPGFDGGKSFSQKIAVATICIIINLEISLKGMAARADQTGSLTVLLNHSIPGICSLLDAQFRDIPISAIYGGSGFNITRIHSDSELEPLPP